MPTDELRDRFAIAALPSAALSDYGLDWGKRNKEWPEMVARQAYSLADAMLRAREPKPKA